MRVYVDSDVLIWHLRGDRRAYKHIARLLDQPEYELWIGALQRAEILFYMRLGEEEATRALLSLFKTAPVDERVIEFGAQIFRKWQPSHGTDVHDAILAATTKLTGGKIVTLNRKHFPMTDLVVESPW